MPTQVQFRRGTKDQNAGFTGADGEISINSESKTIRVHDGSTAGGFELARADMSNVGIGTTLTLSTINSTNINVSGLTSTANFLASGISTLNNLSVSGVSTFAGITTVTGETLFSKQLNVSGVSTYNNNIIQTLGSVGISTENPIQRLQVGPRDFITTVSSGGTVGVSTNIITGINTTGIVIGHEVTGLSTIVATATTVVSIGTAFVSVVSTAGTVGVSTNIITGINTSGIVIGYDVIGLSTIVSAGTTVISIGTDAVGIGTTTLNTTIQTGVGFTFGYVSGTIGLGRTTLNTSVQSGASFAFGVKDDSKVFVVTSNSRVGLGTTLPTSKLHVIGDTLVVGVSTFAGITTVTGETLFAKQLSVSGVSTLSGNVTIQNGFTVSGVSNIVVNSGVVTSSSGIVTYYGDISNAISGRWVVTGTGSPHNFILSGVGLTEASPDPILYLLRGQSYQFINNCGTGEGFYIRTGFSSTQYDNGVIGNGSTNSIITFNVPFNAPNTLFYQSNVNTAMGSTIVIVPNAFL
jgi:fibronectin-binding autotransporter adhesin